MKPVFIFTATVLSVATAPLATALATEAQKEMAAENFMQADGNGDGALTLNEFTALIDLNAEDNLGRASMIKRMGRQSMAFNRLDANTDGLVTTEEISAVAARAKQ